MRKTFSAVAAAACLVMSGFAGAAQAQDSAARLHAEAVGQRAFDIFQTAFLTGDWKAFEATLSDDVSMWFPSLSPQRRHIQGKAAMMAFFTEMTKTATPMRIRFMDTLRFTSDDHHVVLETRVFSENAQGQATYLNRVLVSLEICGEKVCAYREYFGSDRKSN